MPRSPRRLRLSTTAALLVAGALLAACAADETEPPADDASAPAVRTERQRDSVLGESALPGARGVRRARELADSTEARYRGLDTIGG